MPPSTTWREEIDPGEAERFEQYARDLVALAKKTAHGGATSRALHAKGQLGLRAELEVLGDLPEHARVGPFAAPARYKAYVRYSNGSFARQSDRKPDVRGIAIKVVGVAGKKIIPGMENALTQDFLLIRSPSTPFRSADEFVPFVLGAASPALGVPRLFFRFGFRRVLAILKEAKPGFDVPMSSLATTRYFSATAIKLGAYAVRYALAPHASDDASARPGTTDEWLSEELTARLARGVVTYDLRLQFYVDDAKTPIEDASVEWKESDAPFVTVARLTLPSQDPKSASGRRLAEHVERMSFDPWHALEELRPLGNMMRARNHAYRLSTMERKAAPEPDGTES